MRPTTIAVSDSLSLPCLEWKSRSEVSKGRILFLHGFSNHSGNYRYLGDWFSKQGYDFLAYDHRDHGASPLRNQHCEIEDLVNDAKIIIRTLYEQPGAKDNEAGGKIWLMGSSMGGALSILASQGDMQSYLKGLVLWAPHVVATERRKTVFRGLTLAANYFPQFKLPTKGIAVSNLPKQCDNRELTDQIAKDPLMLRNPSLGMMYRLLRMGDLAAQGVFDEGFPMMLLFGGKDTLIFKHDIKMFVEKVKNSQSQIEYRFYPDNRHMLWGESNRHDLYQDVLGWMDRVSQD